MFSVFLQVMRHTKNVFHTQHGCYVIVQFWDVEGSDSRTALECAYKAHAIAVIYDVTNRSSFEKAQLLLDGVNPRASALLIGNKIDMKELRKVSYEEGRLLARIHRVEFIETSAKLNYNVDDAFQMLVTCVPDEYLVNLASGSSAASARRWRAACSTALCALCRRKLERHRTEDSSWETMSVPVCVRDESERNTQRYRRQQARKQQTREALPRLTDNNLGKKDAIRI